MEFSPLFLRLAAVLHRFSPDSSLQVLLPSSGHRPIWGNSGDQDLSP
jgi:hypothetical protein